MAEDNLDELDLDLDTDFEDDLLEDFSDLFPDDDASPAPPSGKPASQTPVEEVVDELDSLLEGFDEPASPPAGDSMVQGAEIDDRTVELEPDELDLSSGLGDDIELDESGIVESPASIDEPALADPLAETSSKDEFSILDQYDETDDESEDAMAKKLSILGILLAMGALGLAGWLFMGTMESGLKVTELESQIAALSARKPVAAPAKGGKDAKASAPATADPRIAQAVATLATIEKRVSELSSAIEGPMSHLQENSTQQFGNISKKLLELDAAVKALQKAQAAGAATTVRTTQQVAAKPAPAKPAPAAKPVQSSAAASAPSKATSSSAWVINLLSLTSKELADEELARLSGTGVKAVMQTTNSDGKVWYRIRVPGYASYDAAKAGIGRVVKLGYKSAWVSPE